MFTYDQRLCARHVIHYLLDREAGRLAALASTIRAGRRLWINVKAFLANYTELQFEYNLLTPSQLTQLIHCNPHTSPYHPSHSSNPLPTAVPSPFDVIRLARCSISPYIPVCSCNVIQLLCYVLFASLSGQNMPSEWRRQHYQQYSTSSPIIYVVL